MHRFRNTRPVPWAGLVAALLLAARLVAGEVATVPIVANAGTPIPALSAREVADIFLGRTRQWADGTSVKLALLKDTSSQEQFLNAYIGRSPNQYWSHWRSKVFSGGGIMPKVFLTEQDLLAYVAAEKGAVGYVTSASPAKDPRLQIVRTRDEVKL